MAAGSNPTVTYLKESILNRRLSKAESLQAISGFPLYIRTPTSELLNELFVMINIFKFKFNIKLTLFFSMAPIRVFSKQLALFRARNERFIIQL